jgi:hypothetical protein
MFSLSHSFCFTKNKMMFLVKVRSQKAETCASIEYEQMGVKFATC